jgi:hypothetical protein
MWFRQAAIEGNTHVVPLSHWTGIVHFARLGIAFAVIGLIAAATAIWGGFAAFDITIFVVGTPSRCPQQSMTLGLIERM